MILSAMLLGMGAGHDVTSDVASLCGYAGLLGCVSYIALHLVAYRRHADHFNATVERVNDRVALNAAAIDDRIPGLIESPPGGPPTEFGRQAAAIALTIHRRRTRRRRNLRRVQR